MKKLSAALLLYLGLASAALAQIITMPPPAGVTIGGCVYNATPPTLASGAIGYIQCGATGQLTAIGVEQPDVTGTFTNATQTTSVTSTSQDGYGTILITISGTYAAASAVFELSDDSGTTWFPLSAARTDGSGSDTGYTSLTNTSRGWLVAVAGFDLVRIRSTAVTSGTANIRISSTSVQTSPVPQVVTPVTISATGTTAATVATLAAVATKTTYLCGFSITSDATAGLAGNATVVGTITGTMTYIQGVGVAPAVAALTQTYNPCIPASAINTTIVITSAAAGVGGGTAVNAWGYQQ